MVDERTLEDERLAEAVRVLSGDMRTFRVGHEVMFSIPLRRYSGSCSGTVVRVSANGRRVFVQQHDKDGEPGSVLEFTRRKATERIRAPHWILRGERSFDFVLQINRDAYR